jgi:hypothetical protein
MPESNKFAVSRHGKKISNGASVLRIAPFEGGGNRFLLRGFRCDDRFIQAAFATIGHIAVDDTALGCLVQSGGQVVKLHLGCSGVATGDGGTKFLLTRFDRGDDGGIAGVTLLALAGAFFC